MRIKPAEQKKKSRARAQPFDWQRRDLWR